MAIKPISFLFILLLFVAPYIHATNGSSGVGNASVLISNDIFTILPQGWVHRTNNLIIDSRTGEKILEINRIQQAKVNQLISSGSLVTANLGSVGAFEFLPKRGSNEKTFWIICSLQQKNCNKIDSKSQTNTKVPAIMGSLKKIKINNIQKNN